MNKKELIAEIKKLKEEKDALILAHYYVEGDLQEIADFVGDSYALAKKAVASNKSRIVFCGVKFMGESAKILNPDKKVFLVDEQALCPMADMVTGEIIEKYRQKYNDLYVVTYINSSAETKVHSDVCITSSNALKIVKALDEKNILIVPDKNLGFFIKENLKEDLSDKNVILHDGYCYVHNDITREDVKRAKEAHPNAMVLVHPEINPETYELADYIGSTSGIIDAVKESNKDEFIICTEKGILHKLEQDNPGKKFYFTEKEQLCTDMKKLTLEKLRDCLRDDLHEVILDQEVIDKASIPLNRMLELAAK